MDSITQIVLGAACGEVALGKKIGNKALLFGAIGGTIPDLDVFIGSWFYVNEIDKMAFHRGFMHSILFAVLGAFLFGWLAHKLYNSAKRKNQTGIKDWIWLFFLSLFTHIMLDSFTPYGTQLFSPISDFRVAFNNISVADPTYTVPFLLCMIVVMFFRRTSKRRRLWLKLGLGISSAYMLFTIANKFYIDSIYKKSLLEKGVSYIRYQTQPTILNNILWYGIAETDTHFYVGFYSILDKEAKVKNWQMIPKNHELAPITDPDIQKLAWFSKRYYNFMTVDQENEVRFNDLRYPLLNADDPSSSVFSFTIFKDGDRWDAKPFFGSPPSKEDFDVFINRIKGI